MQDAVVGRREEDATARGVSFVLGNTDYTKQIRKQITDKAHLYPDQRQGECAVHCSAPQNICAAGWTATLRLEHHGGQRAGLQS